MRWSRGEAIVERSITERRLQRIGGANADGTAWLERAGRTVDTAEAVAVDDPESAYVLAYDAVRQACTGPTGAPGAAPDD
jgi:hypothetical protein